MRFTVNILIGLFFVFTLYCCKDEPLLSEDFTSEFGFTAGIEGPAVNADGDLFAVNFAKEGTIGKVNKAGEGEIFISLPEGSIGNGIRFDLDGDMFIADYLGHKVYRIKKGTKNPEVWAQDSTMNQPNDLAIGPGGVIYLSDPNWAESAGKLWMVTPEREILLLEEGMGTTNGVEVSPDNKTLYVNESVQRMVWKYDIQEDGKLSNKKKFISFTDFGLDGMRCDMQGNLYLTRYDKGTVAIVSPEGKILKEVILKGKKPSNITFGGERGLNCYVTMADRGCLETFAALSPGSYYSKIHH